MRDFYNTRSVIFADMQSLWHLQAGSVGTEHITYVLRTFYTSASSF